MSLDVSPSCSLASLSDVDIAGSDGQAPAIIHIDSSEDKAIYEYLTTHTAFRELVADVEKLIEHHCSDKMEFIRHCIKLSLKRAKSGNECQKDSHNIIFKFEWDLIEFLQEQYSCGVNQEFGSILAVTGQSSDAYCSTVQVYIERTWPDHPTALIKAIQSALHSEEKIATCELIHKISYPQIVIGALSYT